jgi:hypothetical protein
LIFPPVVLRTNFHSSKLIRCLADLAIVDAVEAGNAFAEELGQWIHFADAITLAAVHSGDAPGPMGHRSGAQAAASIAAGAEFDRIQALLTDSVTKSFSPKSDKAYIKLPEPILEHPSDLAAVYAAYAPYRRFYEAHQRDMELRIQPLRARVREALAQASPRLGKLAELDATLEKILRDRETKLLSKVPALLGKRFEHLFREHERKLGESGQADSPATRAQDWLARFCEEMRTLLLAEVELRLQPAIGLLEALRQEKQ